MPLEQFGDLSFLIGAKHGEVYPGSVTTTHPLYDKRIPVWQKCRDAYDGEEEIKAAGTKYLPKLSGQDKTAYTNYLNRAQWHDATRQTVRTYKGMIFRKAPAITYSSDTPSDAIPPDDFFRAMSTEGKSFQQFSQDVAKEIFITNRAGVLVDYPSMNNVGNILDLTRYDYEQLGIRPRLSLFTAETIRNWSWDYIDYKLVPLYFVLKEEIYSSHVYSVKEDIYRVLMLEPYIVGDDEERSVRYRYKQVIVNQTYKRKGRKDIPYVEVKDIVYPMIRGEYLDFIPFYVMDDNGVNFKTIEKPMINGLANVNIGHFRNSADWENELHMVGCKTIFFPGWDPKVYGNPHIGGALAGPPSCEPKILEARSDSGIRTEMDKKVEQMAVLGAERLSGRDQTSSNGVDTSSAAQSSDLTVMANTLSESFTEILRLVLRWAFFDNAKINVSFNTDFFRDSITGAEVLDFMKAMQQGGMSKRTYFEVMKRRELYSEGWTPEDEDEAIQDTMTENLRIEDARYAEIVDRLNALSDRVDGGLTATITSSSTGQRLTSISTQSGGSNVANSTDLREGDLQNAGARNNETRGSQGASAREDRDQASVNGGDNPNKQEDRNINNISTNSGDRTQVEKRN